MFGFKDALKEFFTVAVGLSTTMAKEHRHGAVSVKTADGIKLINFRVDKPALLIKPRKIVIENIFSDVVKMGLVPIGITIDNQLSERDGEFYPAGQFI